MKMFGVIKPAPGEPEREVDVGWFFENMESHAFCESPIEYKFLYQFAMTAYADNCSVTDRTIRNWKAEKNRVYTPKVSAPRKVIRYNLSNYTKPDTAARKLREKFGAAWCRKLATELAK